MLTNAVLNVVLLKGVSLRGFEENEINIKMCLFVTTILVENAAPNASLDDTDNFVALIQGIVLISATCFIQYNKNV